MNSKAILHPRVHADLTEGFSSIRGVHETNHARQLNLIIEEVDSKFTLEIQTSDPDLSRRIGDDSQHVLNLDKATLWAHVQECRQSWRQHLVDLKWTNGEYVFQGDSMIAIDDQQLNDLLDNLAEAGRKLFLAIFHPRPAAIDDEHARRLRRIGIILREEMAKTSRWIRVTSGSFFAPWNLIYSGAEKPTTINGFWGYQHLVEHIPDKGSLANELDASSPLMVGLQIDQTIDAELKVHTIAGVENLLASYGAALDRQARYVRKDFKDALQAGEVTDQILYFCCHTQVEGDFTKLSLDPGYLTLSDPPETKQWIKPSDVQVWMDTRVFPRRPLVFLNACGGGQINSIFYEGFASIFLGLHACSVIGPQTEVPAIFAGELARQFFERFFQGGNNHSIGQILFDLRREFFDQYRNPLGLLYSVYRGADVHLQKPLALPVAIGSHEKGKESTQAP